MDDFSIDILATAAGVAAAVVAIVGLIRVVWPWNLSGWMLRSLSVLLGVGLAALASAALIGPEAPPGDSRVAVLVLFWLFVGLNGATAGLAASAAFDTAKYGLDRDTSKNGVNAPAGPGAPRVIGTEPPLIGETGPVNESPAFAPNDATPNPPREY